MNKTVFIVNPISGTHNKERILSLIPTFYDEGTYEICYTERAGHAEELARRAAEEHALAAIAIGGDGTVNEVGRGLIHTHTSLGIIPCGSGNGLARHLGISLKPAEALNTLKRGKVMDCDYGLINQHPFFCTAGIGFDAQVSDKFAKAGSRGLITYLKTTIDTGFKYNGEKLNLVFDDGECIEGEQFWLVTAGNAAQYGNDFFITPDASLCDGMLDVNLWSPFNKLTAPLIGYQMHSATIHKNSHVRIKRCKKVVISRRQEGPIHWDGDPVWGPKEISIECVKAGLKVIAGKPNKNHL